MRQPTVLTVIVCLVSISSAAPGAMVPFVIPLDIPDDSKIALSSQPLTEKDHLEAKGHFYTQSGERVRLWGVNLSFAANFPTHEDAQRIAKCMAAFGINAVRCHHMDTAKWPRGIWDQTGRELHPEALDRLDFFVDQLAKHGIYTNINLHVGKAHSQTLGLPETPRDYDKMVNLFTPELVAAQKDYARKLLTHPNKYRDNMTYAEDYAVAIVEITNENSLFMWGAENTLRNLPAFYDDILHKKYNQWLKDKHKTTEKLKAAWGKDIEPMGDENLLQNSIPGNGWYLEQHGSAKAEIPLQISNEFPGLKLKINKIDGTDWHLQYNHRELTFEQGRYYTVYFKARAEAEREISVNVGQAHEPWNTLGLSRTVKLTPQWQTYTMGFFATESDDNGRLNFAFGNDDADIELGIVELRTGGQIAVGEDESIEKSTVSLFGEREVEARSIDRMVFLAETEKAYFDDMRHYIKNDLGCKAMVTGTIVFGPLGLYAQSDMDFIDAHAYWQHPRFPNRPWDAGDWLIDQKAMSDYPEEATLYQLAAQRLAGKPFTVTEYNHPAPLDSQAECVPMIASFAAAQDWDGVWLYTYSHSNDDWDREYLNSYFDIDSNPAKWSFVPAGAVIFRQAELQPFGRLYRGSDASSDNTRLYLQALAEGHITSGGNMLKTLGPTMRKAMMQHNVMPPHTSMRYSEGLYGITSENCIILTGRTQEFSAVQGGNVQITRPAFAAVTVVSLDGKPLSRNSHKILITACGRCENTGMKFSEDRRTVGRNWGTAPVLIEPVEGAIALPSLASDAPMTCKILNPDGTVKEQFPVKNGMVPLKADYGTMWYLVER